MAQVTAQHSLEVKRAKAALLALGWNYKTLARKAGLAHGTIKNVMCGSNPFWPPRQAINTALGLDVFTKPATPIPGMADRMIRSSHLVTKAPN